MNLRWVSSAYKLEDTREQVEAEAVMLCRDCPATLHSQAGSMHWESRREHCCKESKVRV